MWRSINEAEAMPNHPGPFYAYEKLAATRERDLARRARLHEALAAAPRQPHLGTRLRRAFAAFLRALADRLEPGRSTPRTTQPGR